MRMTGRERVEAILTGKKPDRPPVTFWRHFYHLENSFETLADAMTGFQKKFDWDLMKINPRTSYHLEDWGATFRFSKNPLIKPRRLDYPIRIAEDWEKIESLVPTTGVLGEHLRAIALINKRVRKRIYKVMTIFTPLSIAGDLVGQDMQLVKYIRQNPWLLKPALENITETFSKFAIECLNAGADGIFLATTQWASGRLITVEEYQEFGLPYARQVAQAVKNTGGIVVLHVCEKKNFLHLFTDFPTDIINWAATEPSNLEIKQGAALLRKPVLGGLDQTKELLNVTPVEAVTLAKQRLVENQTIPFMLGPGCAVPPTVSDSVLMAIRRAVDDVTKKR